MKNSLKLYNYKAVLTTKAVNFSDVYRTGL